MSYFSEHLRFLTMQTSLAPSAAEGAQEATFCPLLSALFLVWSWADHAAMPSHAQGCRSWSSSGGFRMTGPSCRQKGPGVSGGSRSTVIPGEPRLPLSLNTHPAVSPGEISQPIRPQRRLREGNDSNHSSSGECIPWFIPAHLPTHTPASRLT